MAKDHQLTEEEVDALKSHYLSELRKLRFQISNVEEALNSLGQDAAPAEAKPKKAGSGRKKAEKPAKAQRAAKAAKPAPTEETSAPAEQTPAEEAPNKRRPRITVKPPKPLAPVKEKGRRGRPKSTAQPAEPTVASDASKAETSGVSEAPTEKPRRGRKPGQTTKVAKEPKAEKAPKSAKVEDDAKGKGYRLSTFDNYILEALNTRGYVLISSDLISFIEAKYQENNEPFTDEDLKTRLSRSLHKMVNRRGDIKQVKYLGRGNAYALPEWVTEAGETKPKFRRK